MDKIQHKFVQVNGLKIHAAEIGGKSSPAVVFLHGFPEIWYSWRHQMIAVAEAGFRAIAPDCRGYRLSDPPSEPDKATYLDIDSDLLSLLDALSVQKAVIIGKDLELGWLTYLQFSILTESLQSSPSAYLICLPPTIPFS